MLSPEQINSLAQSIFGILPPEYIALRSPEELNAEANAALTLHLDRCHDLAFATGFQSTIGLASPPDYLNRILFINNHILLCGIRFFAGSPARPFVDLLAWSHASPNLSDSPLTPTLTPVDLAHIAPALLQAFAPFKPLAIRILTRGITPPNLDPRHKLPNWSTRGDQVITAATLKHICAQPLPAGYSNIDLIDINLDQALTFMDMAYAHLRATQPFLASRVPPAPREGLIECFEHGRLCFWRLNGETAGIIAVKPNSLHGLKGYLVEEEIVNPAHSGRGTASIAQRHLAESLLQTHPHSPHSPDLTLFGSIDMANPASRRTAARIGRQELLSWWFLSPPGCKI